jgi:hypothetical protein
MTDAPAGGDPLAGLDTVQPIDSAALMREVQAEVERRRAAGEYPPGLDDVPPFGDLALEDDLVASVHRLESLSRIPGVTPVIEEVTSGPVAQPAGFNRRSTKAVLLDRGLVAGRAMARRVVGPRLERVVRQGAEYLMASAQHARVVTARILDIERRLRELEDNSTKNS